MIRALFVVAALAVAGCGSDDTSSGVSTDMSQPLIDLARNAAMCGISVCTGDCSACLPLGGGVCVPPCMTSDPNSCTFPAMCHPIGALGDGGGSATLAGNCGGMYDGYCG